MKLEIRRTRPDDEWILANLVQDLLVAEDAQPTVPHLQKMLTDDRTYLCVAISENRVIGYALAYRFPSLYAPNHLAYLYDIEVLATHRRLGAGRELMHCMQAELRQDGVAELWLGTATDNHAAQALFAATGGEVSGETFQDYTFSL